MVPSGSVWVDPGDPLQTTSDTCRRPGENAPVYAVAPVVVHMEEIREDSQPHLPRLQPAGQVSDDLLGIQVQHHGAEGVAAPHRRRGSDALYTAHLGQVTLC